MDVTLPYLSKLELYGNSIVEIKMPEASYFVLSATAFACVPRVI